MRSNRIRTTVLGATALLAALSLTACGADNSNSESSKAGAAAPVANTIDKQATSQPESPSRPRSATPKAGATEAPVTKTSGSGSGSGTTKHTAPPARTDANKAGTTDGTATSSTKTATCTGGNTRTSVSKVTRPINHLLLTVTNTGNRTCYAYYAPKLRFDDAQAVFPILEDSQPQAVVTLNPGESAYASIGLTGEPGAGPAPRKATHLQVNFAGKNPGSTSGTAAELNLPANTVWDDNGFVTYWQTEMSDALQY
ncbi:DUF4232 domain-containing protein [Streptomyces sp. NBC_00304]|uniref:DUF4232 domain-containing protein n=1 Tax=Streptomyces sp. NBC_00304 TaxID=2975706 RepID=UPI002E2CD649|nr:DUF4232 domain-containing protein [Streptomyces sp. NBC_00304]